MIESRLLILNDESHIDICPSMFSDLPEDVENVIRTVRICDMISNEALINEAFDGLSVVLR